MLSSRLQLHISRQVLKIFNLQIADVVWKETVNNLFFISVFLQFVFFINSLKVFYFMFHVNARMNSFCLYFDSRRIHELDFLLQRLACSSLTPRWFIEALRCINHLVHSEFPISALPCCTVLIMISARVIGLRSLESDVFYNSWPAENCKHFLHQRHVLYK